MPSNCEKRVIERTKELEIKNKDLETFNTTVSHDLKSPLREISSYTSLLLSEHAAQQLDEEGLSYLQHLVGGTERMNVLIENLLLYTKTERQNIKKTDINISDLIDDLLLDYSEEIAKRKIRVHKNLECENLFIDRDAITLVVSNLLDNAIKFHPDHNSAPEITLHSKVSEGFCIVSISDNGIGFDIRFHDKIFEIFQRLHLVEEYAGTGIGLALVKKTMERLGGRVYATSEIGVGSTFYLEIPLE